LIRYCARPSFASENLRLTGRSIVYRFPKPSRTGQTTIQLEPLEFLERIATFIPYPRRHRRHYHGVFAPNSPLRKKVAVQAQQFTKPDMKEIAEKAEKVKVSSNWAGLIARIYEVDPLKCTGCGKNIRIGSIVTHKDAIWRILKGIGLPVAIPEFDPPYDVYNRDICQLIPGTKDGFPEMDGVAHFEPLPDPPHRDDYCDPPHWED
jgi:hypothetical protein